MIFPCEIIQHIFIYANFNDIKACCLACKWENNTFDHLFWKHIFQRDMLPFVNNTCTNLYEWLKEYTLVYIVSIESKLMMNKFKRYHDNLLEILTPIGYFPKRFNIIAHVLGKEFNVCNLFICKENGGYRVKRLTYNDHGHPISITNIMNKQYCIDLLFYIIYYYPEVRIRNKNYDSVRCISNKNEWLKLLKHGVRICDIK